MENEIFPWTPKYDEKKVKQNSQEKHDETLSSKKSLAQTLVERLKLSAPFLMVFLVLLVVFLNTRPAVRSNNNQSERLIEVYTPVFAVPKGEAVPLETLRVISVKKSLFSKTQLLELLNEENLRNFQGKLIAKRSLFPNQAVYWKDLELKKENKTFTPTIIYSN
jgi:hypothetical protein